MLLFRSLVRAHPNWLAFLGLLLFATLVRAQTFNNPVIGFDEQFYLLVGDRMLNGALPYVDIFDRKPIGLFLIYAGARLLGGAGFVQYKIVALIVVSLTSFLIYRAAKPISNTVAALTAAALYSLYLNFMEGEGGQSEVFFNLLMLAAGLCVWQAVRTRERVISLGSAAMFLVGLAIQIKYTVLFEGVFFGLVLLWVLYKQRQRVALIFSLASLWVALALLPTLLAALAYWHLGALNAFAFANFYSLFGRNKATFWEQSNGFLEICGILLPIMGFAVAGWFKVKLPLRFIMAWIAAAVLGMVVFGSFGNAHYGMPLLAPCCIAAAAFFAHTRHAKRWMIGALASLFILSQVVIGRVTYLKGGYTEAMSVARAAMPNPQLPGACIFVYDGFPALYMLTRSCLPSRWVFPGHLNTVSEDSGKALGVNPEAEVARILATRPQVIIDDAPAYEGGNPKTRAMVHAVLAKDYTLTLSQKTGDARFRLVYRRKRESISPPTLRS